MTILRISSFALALVFFVPATSPAQDSLQTDPPEPAVETPVTTESPAVSAPASDHVARATFSHGVEDHEPVDRIDDVSVDAGEVYYFTEIVGLEGATVTHRWLHDGQTMAEVPIEIGGPRWRVYSIKSLVTGATGVWTVQVVSEDGSVLQESTLDVSTAMPSSESPSSQGS